MAKKGAKILSPMGIEPRDRKSQDCAHTAVLLHQSALPDKTLHCTVLYDGSAAADSSNSANTHTCKAKKEQIVIIIPSSLPPGSTPPPPHPGNVVTIISTPGAGGVRGCLWVQRAAHLPSPPSPPGAPGCWPPYRCIPGGHRRPVGMSHGGGPIPMPGLDLWGPERTPSPGHSKATPPPPTGGS